MSRQEEMKRLQQEYAQLNIPEQTLTVVRAGIQRARQEITALNQTEEPTMKLNMKSDETANKKIDENASMKSSETANKTAGQKQSDGRIIVPRKRFGWLTAAAVVAALIVVPNVSPQVALAVADVPILNKVVQIVTLDRYQVNSEENGRYEASVETPTLTATGDAQLQSSVGAINSQVQAYADTMIARFQQEMEQQGGMYGLDVQYTVVTDREDWFTLQVTTMETMASGAQSLQYYNLDKQTERYVQLDDLFAPDVDYVTAISDAIKAQMRQRMADDENQLYFLDSDMPDYDFQQIAADQDFYYNQEGQLVIAFDEYEVAPGYMGCQEFILDDATVAALQNV